MNILRSFSLTLLLASTLAHAMEDAIPHDPSLQIVPFDYEKHHEAAISLWKQKFPERIPPAVLTYPVDIDNKNIYVLYKEKACAGPNSLATLLGFVIHKPTSFSYSLSSGTREVSEASITAATEIKRLVLNTQDQTQEAKYERLFREYIAKLNIRNKEALDIEKLIIEPLNHHTNHELVQALFEETFSNASLEIAPTMEENFDTLVKIRRSDHRIIFLGFIIHETKIIDLPKDNNPQRENSTAINIKYLAINPEDQRKGYGRLLMQHVYNQACYHGSDYIHLSPIPAAVKFYEKLHYRSSAYSSRLCGGWGGMVLPTTARAMARLTGEDPYENSESDVVS